MALCLGSLRVSPAAFWSLTLPELSALVAGALGEEATPPSPSRATLAALMSRFPD